MSTAQKKAKSGAYRIDRWLQRVEQRLERCEQRAKAKQSGERGAREEHHTKTHIHLKAAQMKTT